MEKNQKRQKIFLKSKINFIIYFQKIIISIKMLKFMKKREIIQQIYFLTIKKKNRINA